MRAKLTVMTPNRIVANTTTYSEAAPFLVFFMDNRKLFITLLYYIPAVRAAKLNLLIAQ